MPYFMGTRKESPAELTRDLIEIDLVKTYHWLPQDIARIPYKWLQKYYFIEKLRKEAIETKIEVNKATSIVQKSVSSGRGQSKRLFGSG